MKFETITVLFDTSNAISANSSLFGTMGIVEVPIEIAKEMRLKENQEITFMELMWINSRVMHLMWSNVYPFNLPAELKEK